MTPSPLQPRPHCPAPNDNACFLFQNITKWGPKAKAYLAALRATEMIARQASLGFHLVGVGFVETHVKAQNSLALVAYAKKFGFNVQVAHARQSQLSQGGSHGGAVMGLCKSCQQLPLAQSQEDALFPFRPVGNGEDWCAGVLRLKGVTILIVTVYFTCGQGAEGANLLKQHQIRELMCSLGLPTVVIGDFNATPAEVMGSWWARERQLVLKAPLHVDSSCSNGGRLLDFALCTNDIAPAVTVHGVLDAPFGTHIGLRLEISRRPRAILARRMVGVKTATAPLHAPIISWSEAQVLGSQFQEAMAPCAPDEVALSPAGMHDLSAAHALGSAYASWSATAEVFLAASAGVPVDKFEEYVGRAVGFRTRLAPLVPRRPLHADIYSQPETCALAGIVNATRMLISLVTHRPLSQQKKAIAHWLTRTAYQLPATLFEARNDQAECALPFYASLTEFEVFDVLVLAFSLRDVATARLPQLWLLWRKASMYAGICATFYARRSATSFSEWVATALHKGAGLAHRWTAAMGKPEVPELIITDARGAHEDVETSMRTRLTAWQSHWCRSQLEIGGPPTLPPALRDALADLRTRARTSLAGGVSAAQVADAIRCIKANRKQGVDGWMPSEWRSLPPEALEQLAAVLSAGEKLGTFPVQTLLNFIVLLGKPAGGGERDIALTALYTAVRAVIFRGKIESWSQGAVTFWDDAIKGSSALRAALRRRFDAEVNSRCGWHGCHVLYDMEKFYPSLCPVQLINTANELQLDAKELWMTLQVHLSPRVLLMDDAFSEVTHVTDSIIAGCTRSNPLARIFLYPILAKVHQVLPEGTLSLRSFVDDLAQKAESQDKVRVVDDTVTACSVIAAECICRKLKISVKKTCFLASSPGLRKQIQDELRSVGLTFAPTLRARDLGLDATAGRHRSIGVTRARLTKGIARSARIAQLAKVNQKAKKLFPTGLKPSVMWGCTNMGFSKNSMELLRTQAARCTGSFDPGCCKTTTLALNFGEFADPFVKFTSEVVIEWLRLLREDRIPLGRVRAAWHHALSRLQGRNLWGNVTGPVSCTIAALQQIGWRAPQPDRWGFPEPDGSTHWFEHEPSAALDHPFRQMVEEHASAVLWKRAALFLDGKGAEDGVDFTVAKRHLAYFTKRGLHGHAAILRKALQGGLWPADRIYETNALHPRECTCCELGVPETLAHRVYGCPANRQSTEHALVSSDSLVQHALEQAVSCPIFWLRGLPPRAMVQMPEPIGTLDLTLVADQGVWAAGGVYFGDGSGGADTADVRLRRCGFSVLQLASQTEPFRARGGALAPLPGKRQTVPRAEITALLVLVQKLAQATTTPDSVYFTDCTRCSRASGPGRMGVPSHPTRTSGPSCGLRWSSSNAPLS